MQTTDKSSRRVVALQLAAVLAACAAGYALAYQLGERDNYIDHKIYHAAIRWIFDGHDLYDYFRHPAIQKEGFTYPPFAALLMLPMGFLSEWQAFAVSQVMIMTTTLAITWFLVSPIAERRGWPRWVAVGIATPFVAAVGPVRETFEMGQVGWYLVGLCLLDVYALRSGRRWAGVGIGVAAAIKITPAFFVVYLLVTRQWRAAATAVGAAVAATLLGALLGPAMSWRFWTRTLWDTHRVGNIGSGRNSSVGGLIAHLTSAPGDPPHAIWLPAMVAVLTLGLWRAYRAHQAGDELAAFTITGVTTALLSPISWGHHLVWVVPGIILLVNAALPGERGLSWRPLLLAAAAYTLYVSGAMHHFNRHAGGHNWDGGWVDQLGANSYALGCLAMLAVVPIVERHAHRRPDVLDAELAALRQPQRVP